MANLKIKPVVLSGGSGSRLWPLSRAKYPKQFLDLVGGKSLFAQTLERVSADYGFEAPLVIANEHHRFIVNDQAAQIDAGLDAVILEPVGRNTAPAVAVAALHAAKTDPETLLLFLPSDHVILDTPGFHKAIKRAAMAAGDGYLTCFGMKPTRAETGYGYIAEGAPLSVVDGGFQIQAFKEKPDAVTAEGYLKSGGFSWNSGMFMFRADVILSEMEAHAPAMLNAAKQALDSAHADLNFLRMDRDAFGAVPADSIDYAIMEKTTRAAVVPSEFGWSDLGSFSALADAVGGDENGNAVKGDVIALETSNSYIHSDGRLVATLGVDDLIVISNEDCVMIAPKDRDQDVKKLVDAIKLEGRSEADLHSTVYRPWGTYRSIAIGTNYQVKEIVVYPGRRLSLQMHHHRAEHWVIVEGTAKVTRDDETLMMQADESVYLPLGCKHRLENPGIIPLRLIEVQSGAYLGEDDIVRFEDDFNREGEK
ncbi:mannose-1-phosphate guanylyltransferase/mannose-6-phosphate isomerase [Kordiimonas sp. SCSIO 12610]|uniref:mannose-1-phosphate guanylyltransferase/mannose-6-phosphate isomerase n=1 Tax=Kordiimonas sp. SCSIO 12610 TaxID=2829597 RepID=UPI00210C1F04|nr:mannose-1-phosphate guanylyltransferase/mannose-6-phosphate isomerase [Kordiimonas sp. SCSIO 12610]UTW56278.1 mannose-1-phosphate guanylyltransferase/mannose-6-phosphate isomerase [Kordiimonas sp. SCSIO 12610]